MCLFIEKNWAQKSGREPGVSVCVYILRIGRKCVFIMEKERKNAKREEKEKKKEQKKRRRNE